MRSEPMRNIEITLLLNLEIERKEDHDEEMAIYDIGAGLTAELREFGCVQQWWRR